MTSRRNRLRVLDLFCGGGGWAAGLHALGVDPCHTLGVDVDSAACATHEAAGFPTLEADVATLDWSQFDDVAGLIASPPCQDYSTAGNGTAGTADLTHVVPLAVAALEPDWIVCEQVRAVLPVWQDHARRYRLAGYNVWTGLLDASAYGVPQRRIRAVLIAHKHRPVAPPAATHADGGLFGKPTVTASEALGLAPGWLIDRRTNSRPGGTIVATVPYSCDRPAPTVTGKAAGQWLLLPVDGVSRNVTVEQAARLQGFPDWWPWKGNKGQRAQQVGNAVPPPMGAAILRTVTTGYQPLGDVGDGR